MISASTAPTATRAGSHNTMSHLGSQVSLLLTGQQTGDRFALLETLEKKGTEPPCYIHTREDQVVYVLEGLVSYYADGEWLYCPEGTLVHLPKGSEHTFSVKSEQARLLVMLVPAGLEGYYREMGVPVGQPEEEIGIERQVATAARYGVEITGPAW